MATNRRDQHVRFDPDVHEQIKFIAKEENRTPANLIETIVKRWLKENIVLEEK